MAVAAVALPPSLRALLVGAVDYAGLFPPAQLDLGRAVEAYASYRAGSDAWALGRFVIPASRLAELASLIPDESRGTAWAVSALVSSVDADGAAIDEFNRRHRDLARVDAIEARTSSAAEVERLAALVSPAVEVFAELPPDAEVETAISAMSALGVRAKIRTGGVTPEGFPTTSQILRVLRACHELRVPFKATAGLHHPIRGSYRLTYADDAPRGDMYGYVNLMVGAMLLWTGQDEATVAAMLEERDRNRIRFDDDAVRWQSHRLSVSEIEHARAAFVRGFGSCSFREPLDEAATLVRP